MLVLAVVAQAMPFLLHRRESGKNPLVAARSVWEARYYSLGPDYLLEPTVGHRIPKLRLTERRIHLDPNKDPIRERLDKIPETHFDSLGMIGSLGFLFLLVSLMGSGSPLLRHLSQIPNLARLNIAAILLAIPGGLGTIIAFVALPEIRAYNRIAIFIAFLSLFAIAILVDQIGRVLLKGTVSRASGLILLISATAFGLCDQIPGVIVPDYAKQRMTFVSDRDFVGTIEAKLPPGASVFQIPHVGFPETSPLYDLNSYAVFRPTYHSHTLRWSAGAIKGRDVGERAKTLSGLETGAMLRELRRDGFSGIVVHRDGYEDSGKSVEVSFEAELGHPPVPSADGKMSFFSIEAARR